MPLVSSAAAKLMALFEPRQAIDGCLALALTGVVWLIVKRWPALAANCESRLLVFSGHKTINILFSAALPIFLRAFLLFWVPAPVPATHDEFSHLLLADTIASGRLANPPHPFPEHFETIYVLQSPAYASVYPPGQGLALGLMQRIAGDPWWGVWLSVAAMSAAICWALGMWTSNAWSLLGGILSGLAYCVSTYWMNSYWGGAVSATGGALIFGAIGGLRYSLQASYSFLLALGLVASGLNRPYESCCAGIALLVLALKLQRIGHWPLGASLLRFALPTSLVILAGVAFMAVYNQKVTGSALDLPYRADQKVHGVPQSFVWQQPISAGPFRFKDIEDCYLWQRQKRLEMSTFPSFLLRSAYKLFVIWRFYVNWWFTLPILALLLYPIDRITRAIAGVCVFAFCMSALYVYLLPHYFALYTVIFVYLAMEGLRSVHRRFWRGVPIGALVLAFSCCGGLFASLDLIGPYATPVAKAGERDRIAAELAARGGRHLVFVHYGANHSFFDEWIYNRADIDSSAIVWARDLTSAENERLIRYFPRRMVWLVEGREENAQIRPYNGTESEPFKLVSRTPRVQTREGRPPQEPKHTNSAITTGRGRPQSTDVPIWSREFRGECPHPNVQASPSEYSTSR